MRPFWARPYLVPDSGRFTAALRETIQDPAIRALPLAGAAALRAAVAALLHPRNIVSAVTLRSPAAKTMRGAS